MKLPLYVVTGLTIVLASALPLPAQIDGGFNSSLSFSYDRETEQGSLSWYGAEGFTYFVQHSLELGEPWVYVPDLVLQGEDDLLSIGYSSSEADQSFFRLQLTDTPYTDDLDNDGVTNIDEINANRGPLDFFNAQPPLLTLVSGDGQGDLPEQWLAYPLVVSIANGDDVLQRNATGAVTFSVLSGGGQLSISNAGSDPLLTSLPVSTDGDGLARAYVKLPATVGAALTIQASATNQQGLTASVEFTATVGDSTVVPLGVGGVGVTRLDATHILVVWQDLSNNETGFTIQRREGTGTEVWTTVGTVGPNITEFIDEDNFSASVVYIYRVIVNNSSYPGGGSGGDSEPSAPMPEDPYSDPDVDGLTNLEEITAGTNPHNPNTDNDFDENNEPILDGEDGFPLMSGFSPRRTPIPNYALIDLGFAEGSKALFINDAGQVIVRGPFSQGGYQYYLWEMGAPPTQITVPESNNLTVTGLSNNGVVVGHILPGSNPWYPYWLDPSWKTNYGTPIGQEEQVWTMLPFVWKKSGTSIVSEILEPAGDFDEDIPASSGDEVFTIYSHGIKVDDEGRVIGSTNYYYSYIGEDPLGRPETFALIDGTYESVSFWSAPFSDQKGVQLGGRDVLVTRHIYGPDYNTSEVLVEETNGLTPHVLGSQGYLIATATSSTEYIWVSLGNPTEITAMPTNETPLCISPQGHVFLQGNKLLINGNTGPRDDHPPGTSPNWDIAPVQLVAGINVADVPSALDGLDVRMQGFGSGFFYNNSISRTLAQVLQPDTGFSPNNMSGNGLMVGSGSKVLAQGQAPTPITAAAAVSIDIKKVVSDQITGNGANYLPTPYYGGASNNPMIMGSTSGVDTHLVIHVDGPPGANIRAGVRQSGNTAILNSVEVGGFLPSNNLTFNAIDGFETYEVVAGLDTNANSILDESEVTTVFQKTPRTNKNGEPYTGSDKSFVFIDRIWVATASDFSTGQTKTRDYGGFFQSLVAPTASKLIKAFAEGASSVVGATTTTGHLLDVSTIPYPSGISHPVGAIWNSANTATTQRFEFPATEKICIDIVKSKGMKAICDKVIKDRLVELLAHGIAEEYHITNKVLNVGNVELAFATTDPFTDLHVAIGKATLTGTVIDVEYRATSENTFETYAVRCSGSIVDLYDFTPAKPIKVAGVEVADPKNAAITQAGHATLAASSSFPLSGKVFWVQYNIDASRELLDNHTVTP